MTRARLWMFAIVLATVMFLWGENQLIAVLLSEIVYAVAWPMAVANG